MTRQLKDLMDQAADRSTPYVPDLDQLLTAGRRDVRKRRVVSALTSAAAVVLVSCMTAFALNLSGGSAPDPAASGPTPLPTTVTVRPQTLKPTTSTKPPATATTLCETDAVFPNRVLVDSAASWPEVILSVGDSDGKSTIRRSPKNGEVAYCTTRVPISGTYLPLRAAGFWTGPLGPDKFVHRFDGTGCGTAARRDCDGAFLAFSGRVPTGVTRVVLEAAGRTQDAVLKNGFYAIKFYEPGTGKEFVPGKLKFYVGTGALLVEAQG